MALLAVGFGWFGGCLPDRENLDERQERPFTDYFGESVLLPDTVVRVVMLYYVQAEIACSIGAGGKVVAIGRLGDGQSPLIEEVCPQMLQLPRVGNGGFTDYESVLALHPDIVFCGPDGRAAERFRRLGVPAYNSYPSSAKDLLAQITTTGEILGDETDADAVVKFLRGLYELVSGRTSTLSEEDRPWVYYARTDALTTLGGSVNSDVMRLVGGRSVAEGFPDDISGVGVSMEDIYRWDPEVIIIRDRASFRPSDLLNDPGWRDVRAVRAGKVFQETRGWTEFREGAFFGFLEKAKWLKPDLFADVDPAVEYERFLGLLRDEQGQGEG